VETLTWDQVRCENGQMFLWFTQEKTKETQALPLSEQAASILNARKDSKPSPRLRRKFDNNVVFKLPTSQTVDRLLKVWVKRAGIGKTVSFHVGRHTFAALSLTYGADLYTVSKLLGHANIQTTKIYAEVIDATKRNAVNMLPKL